MEGQPAYASLDMTFEADRPTSQAKLMLDLKNTMWMDHSFERFCASFGDKYETFARRQQRRAAEEKEQWMDDEGMTLAVKVERHGNWELVDRINMVGPLASRSVVVPIPGQVQAGEQLRIRLECGYHFWEVDQAAMDFSVDGPVIVDNLPLLEAHDESGRDVRASLLDLDGDVMSQLFTGAEATLRFDATSLAPPDPRRRDGFPAHARPLRIRARLLGQAQPRRTQIVPRPWHVCGLVQSAAGESHGHPPLTPWSTPPHFKPPSRTSAWTTSVPRSGRCL